MSGDQKCNEMVKVVVRCRPMSEKEKCKGYLNSVSLCPLTNTVKIYDPKNEKFDSCKVFNFDAIYDYNCNQVEIYHDMVRPLIDAVLNGFNSTVLAYGQSGSGKTYTMEGNILQKNSNGIISKTFEQIFDHISKSCSMQYLVRTSYIEIYQDEIRDLLNKNGKMKYELREKKDLGVYVQNISSFVCKNVKQMEVIMNEGRKNRTVGITDMNERSSRSHAILAITVEIRNTEGPLQNRVRVGKLNLVDLAGSERQNKTNADGKRLKEAKKINLSLTALGNVIFALASNKAQYIPYRDSKLTRLLRDSLGGNSKTLMVANIGPASYNYDESLNTLRYASRTRKIKNKPQINQDPVDALIRKYQEEIFRLKHQLALKTRQQMAIHKCVGLSGRDVDCVNLQFSTRQLNMIDIKDNILSGENHYLETKEYVNGLIKRIESMESKLLTGSANCILEYSNNQQKVLEVQTNVIRESKQREKVIQELLDQEEETAEEIREEYSNLQNEIEIKSKKLLKMFHKLNSIQEEIRDAMDEFNADREDLQITEYELFKDLKLRLLIMDNYIPKTARRQVLSRFYFDESTDTWKIISENDKSQIVPKLKCFDSFRRPTTLYTIFTGRKAKHMFSCDRRQENKEESYRFKCENLLQLGIVYAPCTTRHYEVPKISSTLNILFQTALQAEKDIDIDVRHLSLTSLSLAKLPERILQSNFTLNSQVLKQNKRNTGNSNPVYPIARGLVSKK